MRSFSIRGSVPLALVAWLTGCSSSNDHEASGEAGAPDGGDASMSSPTDGGGVDASDATTAGDSGSPTDGGDAATGSESGGPPFTFDAGDGGGGHILVSYPSAVFDSGVAQWVSFPPAANASFLGVGTMLDTLSPGVDDYASLSRDGQWLALVTSRFSCSGGGCLAVARADGTAGGLVKPGGQVVYPEDRASISSGGTTIVYPAEGGPHGWDLYATTLSAGSWSAPLLLTAGMQGGPNDGGSGEFAHWVGFSPDGASVVFECGPSEYQTPGADICVSKLDGTSTTIAVSHLAWPGTTSSDYTHAPDYAPDGTIVFEAEWNPAGGGGSSERIWRFTPSSGTTLALVTPTSIGDDNSPCVLPDGRIASLWLPNSNHELKVMNADGTNGTVIEADVDIEDVGTSCGW
jgi:hypothetical protein